MEWEEIIMEGNLLFESGYMSITPKSWRTEERACIICGNTFIPSTYHQKTCSPQCSLINKRRMTASYQERYKKDRHVPYGEHVKRVGTHMGTRKENAERKRKIQDRRKNMEEIARIALVSNGNYGQWVTANDR